MPMHHRIIRWHCVLHCLHTSASNDVHGMIGWVVVLFIVSSGELYLISSEAY